MEGDVGAEDVAENDVSVHVATGATTGDDGAGEIAERDATIGVVVLRASKAARENRVLDASDGADSGGDDEHAERIERLVRSTKELSCV